MRTKMKEVKVLLPEAMKDEFFSVFPGRGERSIFLRHMVGFAIALKKEKSKFIDLVEQEAREAGKHFGEGE